MEGGTKETTPLTNYIVFELRSESLGDTECVDKLFNSEWAHLFSSYKQESLRRKVADVFKKIKTLKKQRKETKLNEYLNLLFEAPSSVQSSPAPLQQLLLQETKSNRVLGEKIASQNTEIKDLTNVVKELQEEHASAVKKIKLDNSELEKGLCSMTNTALKKDLEITQLTRSLEKKTDKERTVKNLKKTIKRRDETNAKLSEKTQLLEVENKILETKIAEQLDQREEAEMKVRQLQDEKLTLQKKMSRLKGRVDNLLHKTSANLESEIRKKTRIIQRLENLVDFLENKEPENGDDEMRAVRTFCKGKYSANIREACISLLTTCNVSLRKLPTVIDIVLKKLTGTAAESLPSQATLSRMFADANIIACKQVAEEMLEDFQPTDIKGNVLHQDATTKFHHHYEGAQITLKDGRKRSIGLHEVAGGDAETYFKSFLAMIDDLVDAFGGDTSDDVRAKLITSFKSFMNDRCAVNGVFTPMVEKLRKDLIPAVIDNFETMTPADRDAVLEMGHFACRLHLLSNFGTAADTGLKAYENCVTEGTNPHAFANEDGSGTLRLVRTAAKAFTQRGCDKSGVNSYFDSFLHGRGEENQMITFVGHRFNVVFQDGGAVYYHQDAIKAFLDSWPNPNNLLRSIKFDIGEKVFISGARALGIVGDKLTQPLQSLMSSNNITILHINDVLQELHATLEAWAADGTQALVPNEKGQSEYLYSTTSAEDVELNALTALAIEMISLQMISVLERQAGDQLKGGALSKQSEVGQAIASNVPPSNLVSEQDMGRLDNILRAKPSASTATIQAIIMWQRNAPTAWLDGLSKEEKEATLNDARRQAPHWRQKHRNRLQQLREEKLRRLKKKQEEKTQEEEKQINTKLKLTKDLEQAGGLWSVEQLNFHVNKVEEKERRKAILAQLRFLRGVVGMQGPKKLFQESVMGKVYSTEELLQNLRQVLTNENGDVAEKSDQAGLVYKDREDYLIKAEEKKKEDKIKLVDARLKRLSKQEIENDLATIQFREPALFIGKKFMLRKGGEWNEVEVLSVAKLSKLISRTQYDIVYVNKENVESSLSTKLNICSEFRQGNIVFNYST